ncbi:hypothetical protein ACLB2K_045496 [Fragaria x ananassa]
MASIDNINASFGASLALADRGKAPDLGKVGGGSEHKSSLLGKPLTRRPACRQRHFVVDSAVLKSHFLRTWMVERQFRVQERAENLFLFSFDSVRDCNKVLRGGVWYFGRTPVALEIYDGICPFVQVPMKHVLMWVRVTGIPPLSEVPRNFQLVGVRCEETPLVDQTTARVLGFTGSSSRNPSGNFAFAARASNKSMLQSLAPSSSNAPKKKKPVILSERLTAEGHVNGSDAPDLGVNGLEINLEAPNEVADENDSINPPIEVQEEPAIIDAHLFEETKDDMPVTYKRKLGRSLGSKSKNPKSGKKSAMPPLRITLPTASGDDVSPSDRGKGKL